MGRHSNTNQVSTLPGFEIVSDDPAAPALRLRVEGGGNALEVVAGGVTTWAIDSTGVQANLETQVLNKAYGIKAATFDRRSTPVVVGSYASGTIRTGAVVLLAGQVITQIGLGIVTAGVGITGARLGIYDIGGNLLGQTPDMSAAFQGTGWQLGTLTSPVTIPSSGLYYLAVWQQYSTSAALMAADNAAGVSFAREPIVPGGARGGWKMVGQTGLITPATPAESGFMPLLAAI